MLLAGVCNCGPDAFVSGSIAAELGERENAQSAVAGFVNGISSFRYLILQNVHPHFHAKIYSNLI